ncbi:hypothetical protein AQUCO_12300005v1 [Aquilegia coerulea]|uniref:Uncharacterized protein n=1 Tax=Aquilegia coerulea TaxID=218851 RepID=A0A2G5C1J7_AQUCA|nr:hypothetical protein AQUCO_12300005v1 [Aquilegia coerulea]
MLPLACCQEGTIMRSYDCSPFSLPCLKCTISIKSIVSLTRLLPLTVNFGGSNLLNVYIPYAKQTVPFWTDCSLVLTSLKI